MKIFTLLILCLLANQLLGWSLLLLTLVAVISYGCERVFDNLIVLTLRKFGKSFVVGATEVAVNGLEEKITEYINETLKD